MNVAEYLTNTRLLSWVNRKHHLQKLLVLLPDFNSAAVKKIYLLGYAEANEQVLTKIIQCVQNRSVQGLKRIFNSLPYGEDALGTTVIGDMYSVYLTLFNSGSNTLCVVRSATKEAVFYSEASDLPYCFLSGKRIVYPPLSLLPVT